MAKKKKGEAKEEKKKNVMKFFAKFYEKERQTFFVHWNFCHVLRCR